MPQTGQRVGEYVLSDRIGGGAFGEVWRARHHAWDGRVVAVKIPSDPQFVRLLQQEGMAVRGLSHPNIVPALNFDPYADPPYLVMEYVPGESLREVIRRGPLPVPDAVAVMRQVLAALAHAHERGLVHRDVKPENVLIDRELAGSAVGAAGAVRLTDFGLGKAVAASPRSIVFSQEGGDDARAAGTMRYMAPEQLEGGEVDARADLYACGVVLFEMLTGHLPAGVEVPSELNPAVPAALDEVFRRAVARKERRFASVREFDAALASAVPGAAKAAEAPSRSHSRVWPVAAAMAAVGIATAILVAAATLWPQGDTPASTPAPPSPPRTALQDPHAREKQVTGGTAEVRRHSGDSTAEPATRESQEAQEPGAGIEVVNRTDATEAGAVVRSVTARHPAAVAGVGRLELLTYLDGTALQRHSGGPRQLAGSYSPTPVAGQNDFIMLWGVYQEYPAGRYLIVYRIQLLSPLRYDQACFLDVCSDGNGLAGHRPGTAELPRGEWREIPVALELRGTTTIEYRLWPHTHVIALDRIYVFRVN